MKPMTTALWPHSEECCGREPIVGARYERMRRDILDGRDLGLEVFEIVSVEPIRLDKIFCRHMTLRCLSNGREFRPQVAAFWADPTYRAIENVAPFPIEPKEGGA